MMRVTVEIDECDLKAIQKETGKKKISPAINAALLDYLEKRRRAKIINRFMEGHADYSSSNEDLERRDVYEAD